MPLVYNRRHNNAPSTAIYVGRGTPWGNPYPVWHPSMRDWACEMFEAQILPTLDVETLRGKDLICWCAPLRCHADSIIRKLKV